MLNMTLSDKKPGQEKKYPAYSRRQCINKGKTADIYGISIEHVLYGGDMLRMRILNITLSSKQGWS